MIRKSILALLLAVIGAQASAAVDVNTSVFNYSQNFDTLAATGTTSVAWANDSTIIGWSLFKSPAPVTAVTGITVGTGSSNTGAFYSFGTTNSTERALGGVGSGQLSGWIAASFTNNTGNLISNITIGFDGEQWRNGGNANMAAQSMVLQYGFGNAFGDVTTWNAPGGNFDWTSPVVAATAGAVDGNVAGKVSNRGGTIINQNWTTGSTLWVRWFENNDAYNDHGLAIDNFSLSVTAVPEPKNYAMLLAGLGVMGFIARRRISR